ncbi:MAG: hypothetical protein LUE12_08160 [Ruminococcus sp.]|nr:hypothetical protein [Ruminococcus sp.]
MPGKAGLKHPHGGCCFKGGKNHLKKRRNRLEKKEGQLMAILDRECSGEKTDIGIATLSLEIIIYKRIKDIFIHMKQFPCQP